MTNRFDNCLKVGQSINGYNLLTLLGKGNFGQVWEASASLSDVVAIKQIILKQGPFYLRQKNLVEAEIAIMQRLNHPNLIRLLDHFVLDDVYYLVMPVYDTDLAKYIDDCGGRISEERAITFLKQLGMAFMELGKEKIIHRDIKLENILMDSKTCNLAISDFGLSSFGQEMTGSVVGTPIYCAPEIKKTEYGFNPARIEYDSKVDIFSLGIVCYSMITGEHPFDLSKCNNSNLLNIMVANVGAKLKFPQGIVVSDFTKQLLKDMTEPKPVNRVDWREFFERLDQWKPQDGKARREFIPNDLKSFNNPMLLLDGFVTQESMLFEQRKAQVHAEYEVAMHRLRQEAAKMDRFDETQAEYQSSWQQTCQNYLNLVEFLFRVPQSSKILLECQLKSSCSLGTQFADCLEDLVFLSLRFLDGLVGRLLAACADREKVRGFVLPKHEYFLRSRFCENFVRELQKFQKTLLEKAKKYASSIQSAQVEDDFVTSPDFKVTPYNKKNAISYEVILEDSELQKSLQECQEHLIQYTIHDRLERRPAEAKELKGIHAQLYLLLNLEQELHLVATPAEPYNFKEMVVKDFMDESMHHYLEKAKKAASKPK